jgi:hypothetical protein
LIKDCRLDASGLAPGLNAKDSTESGFKSSFIELESFGRTTLSKDFKIIGSGLLFKREDISFVDIDKDWNSGVVDRTFAKFNEGSF